MLRRTMEIAEAQGIEARSSLSVSSSASLLDCSSGGHARCAGLVSGQQGTAATAAALTHRPHKMGPQRGTAVLAGVQRVGAHGM